MGAMDSPGSSLMAGKNDDMFCEPRLLSGGRGGTA